MMRMLVSALSWPAYNCLPVGHVTRRFRMRTRPVRAGRGRTNLPPKDVGCERGEPRRKVRQVRLPQNERRDACPCVCVSNLLLARRVKEIRRMRECEEVKRTAVGAGQKRNVDRLVWSSSKQCPHEFFFFVFIFYFLICFLFFYF